MKVLAIDPGTSKSAWLLFNSENDAPLAFGLEENHQLLNRLLAFDFYRVEHVAVEMVASYGMAVGKEVFETCVWIGRFIQAARSNMLSQVDLVYRKDVKLHLCGSMRAKDGNIRRALIDRFGAPGSKKQPGKTYGISKDIWSALAIAATYSDKHKETK